MKKIKCDVVVVGAGPGGSMAAKTCAKYGLDTVLVEKKEYPSKPNCINCGVERRIFDYIKIDKKFVSSPTYKFVDISPDGTEISKGEPNGYEMGYILNRKTFDKEVLKLALKEGSEYLNKTRATGLIREDGKIKGVKAKIDEKEDIEIRSNIVIGADGVESKVGRWARIYKKTEIDDLAIEVDYRLNNVNVREEYEYTHAHIFGKPLGMVIAINTMGNGRVSVSALSTGFSYKLKKGQLLDSLNNFIKNNNVFSKGKIVEMGCGAQSVSPLKKFTADGIMLVGDAAHQTNLPHACGVLNTMDAGEMAGEAAVEAHEEEDFSYNILSRYEKRWYGLHGEHNFVGSTLLKILSAFAR